MTSDVKVIAFDADDTLWINEPYFQDAENEFAALFEHYMPHHSIKQELFQTEIKNLDLYGYGVKGFMLSCIETASRITEDRIDFSVVNQIIAIGQRLLGRPIILLDQVEETLKALYGTYKLIVATKGDLLDQERKLANSGLEHYFHHVEIMSRKSHDDYRKLIRHLDCEPKEFMMIGNSLKSDVIPVVELGGVGVHIPYVTTWAHERVETEFVHDNFYAVKELTDILDALPLIS